MLKEIKRFEIRISDEEEQNVLDKKHFRGFKEKILKKTLLDSFSNDIKISEYLDEKVTKLKVSGIFLNESEVLNIIRLITGLYNECDLKEPELELLNEVLNLELKRK